MSGVDDSPMQSGAPLYYQFWAKAERGGTNSYHLLPYHLLDVAAVGWRLFESMPDIPGALETGLGLSNEQARRFLCFLLALHDLGKFSHTFQCLRPDIRAHLSRGTIRPCRPYGMHHSAMGKLLWEEGIIGTVHAHAERDSDIHTKVSVMRHSFAPWIDAAMGHHGTPVVAERRHYRDKFSSTETTAAREFSEALLDFLLPHPLTSFLLVEPTREWSADYVPRLTWLFAGFAVLADWIGSNAEFFPLRNDVIPLQEYWEDHALIKANAAITALRLRPTTVRAGQSFQTLFHLKEPTPLQRYALDCAIPDGPNLYILEDLTGAGKTEAALMLAYRMMEKNAAEGWYFALPTQATANGMFSRVARMYSQCFEADGNPQLVLAHGGRAFHTPFLSILSTPPGGGTDGIPENGVDSPEYAGGASCSAWIADNARKAFLAQVGVGTIDQALLSVLPVRYQSLRLHGLARKVLIVDEVHAYDSYMRKLLACLLSFHAALGGSAILLSATLPHAMRMELMHAFRRGTRSEPIAPREHQYPLATHVGYADTAADEIPIPCRIGGRRGVQFTFMESEQEVLGRIATAVESGQCICWIRNTVRDAIDAWPRLATIPGIASVDLFHARFTQWDRARIESDVMTRFGYHSTPEMRASVVIHADGILSSTARARLTFSSISAAGIVHTNGFPS